MNDLEIVKFAPNEMNEIELTDRDDPETEAMAENREVGAVIVQTGTKIEQ